MLRFYLEIAATEDGLVHAHDFQDLSNILLQQVAQHRQGRTTLKSENTSI